MIARNSKATDERGTPRDLFDKLSEKFGPFTIDVAATPENRLTLRWCGRVDGENLAAQSLWAGPDGLAHDWTNEVVWCNPPYSKPLPWVQKGPTAKRAVYLLKSDTSTSVFRFVWEHANGIYFLTPRVTFAPFTSGADFPNMVAVFDRASTGRSVHLLTWKDPVAQWP